MAEYQMMVLTVAVLLNALCILIAAKIISTR